MKKYLIVVTFGLLGVVFFLFGRSIYVPLYSKIKGKETVESVVNKTQNHALDRLQSSFDEAGFKDFPSKISIVVFKEEQKLQVFGHDSVGMKFIKEYPFTAFSGKLGPKLKGGDRQIPEGIYKVEYLNPNSSYHLSIKISYPNKFDKSKTKFLDLKQMGGDIFIHGKSVTIGCIPIGDEAIEEVFIMTQKAFNNEIVVIISPRDFRINNRFPQIDGIEWEEELYQSIKQKLDLLPNA